MSASAELRTNPKNGIHYELRLAIKRRGLKSGPTRPAHLTRFQETCQEKFYIHVGRSRGFYDSAHNALVGVPMVLTIRVLPCACTPAIRGSNRVQDAFRDTSSA
jgi:hypothetical protein